MWFVVLEDIKDGVLTHRTYHGPFEHESDAWNATDFLVEGKPETVTAYVEPLICFP